jgi:hypothetical protein
VARSPPTGDRELVLGEPEGLVAAAEEQQPVDREAPPRLRRRVVGGDLETTATDGEQVTDPSLDLACLDPQPAARDLEEVDHDPRRQLFGKAGGGDRLRGAVEVAALELREGRRGKVREPRRTSAG